MPHFLRFDQALHLQVRQMVTDRDGINLHCLGKFIDRDFRVAKQRLKNLIFRAFHGKKYNSPH
jgi:hypothetical protein